MLRFRKLSMIPFTVSQYRIGQTSATTFNTDGSGTSTRQLWEVAASLLPTP